MLWIQKYANLQFQRLPSTPITETSAESVCNLSISDVLNFKLLEKYPNLLERVCEWWTQSLFNRERICWFWMGSFGCTLHSVLTSDNLAWIDGNHFGDISRARQSRIIGLKHFFMNFKLKNLWKSLESCFRRNVQMFPLISNPVAEHFFSSHKNFLLIYSQNCISTISPKGLLSLL